MKRMKENPNELKEIQRQSMQQEFREQQNQPIHGSFTQRQAFNQNRPPQQNNAPPLHDPTQGPPSQNLQDVDMKSEGHSLPAPPQKSVPSPMQPSQRPPIPQSHPASTQPQSRQHSQSASEVGGLPSSSQPQQQVRQLPGSQQQNLPSRSLPYQQNPGARPPQYGARTQQQAADTVRRTPIYGPPSSSGPQPSGFRPPAPSQPRASQQNATGPTARPVTTNHGRPVPVLPQMLPQNQHNRPQTQFVNRQPQPAGAISQRNGSVDHTPTVASGSPPIPIDPVLMDTTSVATNVHAGMKRKEPDARGEEEREVKLARTE
ncbi:hypothetical protein BT69DRAFT_282198 [Atractiella rhizophila]|nr:hypothetical protein BT69DRAFT_282198 [Atractiella rhizophila]